MVDLRKGTRGVNLLVTALDRHVDSRRWQRVDAQVDYRDPRGRTQTNPHLTSRRMAGAGAAVGLARGLRTGMANREAKSSATEKGAPSAGPDLVSRMGEAMGRPSTGARTNSSRAARLLSERYDYQFEEPQQPGGGEQQFGR